MLKMSRATSLPRSNVLETDSDLALALGLFRLVHMIDLELKLLSFWH